MDLKNPATLMVGGAALGTVFSCFTSVWSKVKGIAWKISRYAIRTATLEGDSTPDAVVGYLVSKYSHSKAYDPIYAVGNEYIKSERRSGLVAFERFGTGNMVFWSRCRKRWLRFIFFPLIYQLKTVSQGEEKDRNGNVINNSKKIASVTFIKGTVNMDEIVSEAITSRNIRNWSKDDVSAATQKRFFIKYVPHVEIRADSKGRAGEDSFWYKNPSFRLLNVHRDDLGRGGEGHFSRLDQLVFPPSIQSVIEEVKIWRRSRAWYEERHIPWKRGLLLYGPGGTGKTALARACAEDFDMPIFVYALSEVMNFEFMREWKEMEQHTPCIALMEDFDNAFHGRQYVGSHRHVDNQFASMMAMVASKGEEKKDKDETKGGHLGFDTILNCIDGVSKVEGIFTIITTNDITKIDPAIGQPRTSTNGDIIDFIGTRPGRIDKVVHLGHMTHECKLRMAKKIVGMYPSGYEEVLRHIETHRDFKETPAQFQTYCGEIALRCHWESEVAREQEAIGLHRRNGNHRELTHA